MNKKLLIVLAGIATLSLSSCGGKKDETSASSSSNKNTSSSSTASSSSSSSVAELDRYTEQEIAEGKAYLEGEGNNKSFCKIGEGTGWTQYCTEGEKEYVIKHANYNTANNVGDITIIQHTGTSPKIKAPTAIPGKVDTFPEEENKDFYQDFQLNHCYLSTYANTDLCRNKYIDEGNHWNFRIMVGTDGKIAAMYPGGVGYANPVEPYFSNYEYDVSKNDDMYLIYTRDFQGIQLADDNEHGLNEKHSQAWTLAEPGVGQLTTTGFNILEHPAHNGGRYDSYKFVGGGETDLITWAFVGSIKDGDNDSVDYSRNLTHFDQILTADGIAPNPEEVWALKTVGDEKYVGWAFEFANFYIPGQFDDVRFQYERTTDLLGIAQDTEVKLTEIFEYDPWSVYTKFKKYADYLRDLYDNAGGQTSGEADNLYDSLPNLEKAIEDAIYGLNCAKIREGEVLDQLDATSFAESKLEEYKYTLKDLKSQL